MIKNILSILTLCIFLSGCAGVMQGNVNGGKKGETAQFSYEGPIWDSGKITATLSDGEVFKGKYVNKSGNTYGVGLGFGGNGGLFSGKSYSGEMIATLMGDKGNTMQCIFTPNHIGPNIFKSGVGKCEISDGRKIDVIF